jgi:hypothetical protein
MKPLSETKALSKLDEIRNEFRGVILRDYEQRAKSCAACETPGACCLDEHFVNVRITRLEAVAIDERLNVWVEDERSKVLSRVEKSIEKFSLDRGERSKTYACPLFEKGVGCLVHDTAKPLPCIAHACYERKEDLPPDGLLTEREMEVEKLNRRVYGTTTFLPIPLAVRVTRLRVQIGTG